MLTQPQLQNLIEFYLQEKLGASFAPERMFDINTPVLAQALEFYEDLCGGHLSLAAIGSGGETRKLQADREKILFKMLDDSLQTSGDNSSYQILSFDKEKARQAWLTQKTKINLAPLSTLHGVAANLGIAEKFLLGNIHGQEWLTDIDLERLAKACDIKDKISITRLNPSDIGTILHFNRRNHGTDNPYQIPLLLNKGSSGDISSQGSHWVCAMLEVDPVKKEIQIKYRDSMHMSSVEKDKIKSEITKAINYKQSSAGIPPAVYKAFPGFKLSFDMADANSPQGDGWSCGYRAFKGLVDMMPANSVNNAQFQEIKNLTPQETTSDNLRAIVYKDLLNEVEVTPAVMQEAKIDNGIVDMGAANTNGKINENYLKDFVEHIATVKPNRAPVKLSPEQLQELREIEEYAQVELEKLESLWQLDYSKKESEIDIDLATIIKANDSSVVVRGKLLAVYRLLAKFESPATVVLDNISILKDPVNIAFFNKQFNLLKSFISVKNEAEHNHEAARELELINERNKFIDFLNIKISPDENPWQEIWRNRISNGGMLQDRLFAMDIFNLYSESNDTALREEINNHITKMPGRYMQEFLNFLGNNAEFFQSTDNGFPYSSLQLVANSYDGIGEYAQIAIDEMGKVTEWCAAKHYFPFKTVDIILPELNDEYFAKFMQFVVALNEAGVETLHLKMFDANAQRVDFTAEQSQKLVELYQRDKLSLSIANNDIKDLPEDAIDRKMQLENLVVINRRQENIERSKGNVTPAFSVAVEIEDEEELPKQRNIRPYKLNKNTKPNLNVEVNVEQQLEVQQQHQLQTQLSQEVQQQVQMVEQNQAEIDDVGGNFQGESLISQEKYSEDMDIYITLMSGLGTQKCNLYKNISSDEHSQFWLDAFGHPPRFSKGIHLATQSALDKMHTMPQYFVAGINMDNLPQGFFVQQYGKELVFCFDETKFIENKNQSPLTVKLTSVPFKKNLIGDQRAFMPNNTDPSSPNKNMSSQDWTLEKFYGYLEGSNQNPIIDINKFKKDYQFYLEDFAVDKPQIGNSLYALVDVLYVQGVPGVDILFKGLKQLHLKDPELYDNFKRSFIEGQEDIRNLLKPGNMNVLHELTNLSAIEKKWWRKLVAQHTLNNSNTEPQVLFEGFQYFLKRLKEVNIPLPFDCPIHNSSNMLVSLDLLLAVLGKVQPRNLADQLDNLQGLSFRPEGAWYASRWLNFHYFHPAMGLSPEKIDISAEMALLGRNPADPTYKIDYADLVQAAKNARDARDARGMEQSLLDIKNELIANDEEYAELFTVSSELNQEIKDGHQIEAAIVKHAQTQMQLLTDRKEVLLKLKELAKIKDRVNYTVTLFHRYMGSASRINSKYQYYVDLMDSLQQQPFFLGNGQCLIPILALATSGERGSESLDAIPLFTLIGSLDNDVARELLLQLAAELKNWAVTPNLDELTSLTKLLVNSTLDKQATLKILGASNSVATLTAIKLWEQNTQHIDADDFIRLYERAQTFDADKLGELAKIFANLQPQILKKDEDQLFEILKQLKTQSTYDEIIKVLSSIDTAADKTLHENLPGLAELNAVLTGLVDIRNNQEIFSAIALALPNCKFDLASNSNAPPPDFANAMQQSLDDFNAILSEYGIAPLEGEDLKDNIAKHIQAKLKEIEKFVTDKYGAIAWGAVKNNKVYSNVMQVAKEAVLANMNMAIVRFPQLNALRENKFPEPMLDAKYESIGNNIAVLTEYSSNVSELFNSLLQLRNRWSDFDIDFLINSPRTNQFTSGQMQRIFAGVNLLDVSFIPVSLLNSIFAGKPLTRADNQPVNTEQLTRAICQIIDMPGLNLVQRSRLIDVVTTAKDPTILDDLIPTLTLIKDKNPSVLNESFNIMELYYQENTDNRAIKMIASLLNVFDEDQKAGKIYFNGLSKNLNAFVSISEVILADVEEAKRKEFAKIVVHSCLEQEADAQATLANFDVVVQLAEFSKTAGFEQLTKLYEQRPYPKLAKLEQFLALKTDAERIKFVNEYEFDPSGLLNRKTLATFLDISTIDDRIDGIRDLSRDGKNPLFYAQRRTLKEELVFVNAVCSEYPISVPGESSILNAADKQAYKKPVLQLTKKELQTLVRHYREVINDPRNDAQTTALARLEFVALARIAMFRTTAKMPYSTQIESLLNVMMHGGNIFSEIRTGEGKGSITALFAANKWMDGGAVDVCSSNMELAGRDLEEFEDYYEYLGIETKLVRAKTPHADYKQDGINYSDVSELALFQQQCELLQLKLPTKVSCVLDEADFIALDNTTQFRFATSLDPSFNPHMNPWEWLYPVILEFVATERFKDPERDVVDDIRALKEYVSEHPKLKNAQKSKFYKVGDTQLDKWIDSAYTASQLVEGEDFAVRDSHVVREGQSLPVQVARVKILHRENADSSFSNGVHQFLHTRLNLQIDAQTRTGKKFPIEPEKTYLASKSAKNFIDYYTRRGNVLGLTGTVGSEKEVKELRKNYGFKFYKIPPHKPLVRTDHAPVLARRQRKGWFWLQKETAKEAHQRTILEQCKKYRGQSQPVIPFCDGVASSQELYDYLLTQLGPDKLQLYNGEQLNVREKDLTHTAGLSEEITVTTPMLGRGNDFKPHYANGDPVMAGLAVLDTFISPDRDFGQKIGRSGRNNARGDTVLVASEEEFTSRGMPVPRNEAELIVAIEKIKASMTQENFLQRRERQLFADVKDQFFNQYISNCRTLKTGIEDFYQQLRATGAAETWKPLQHECHLVWEQFLNKLDGQWNTLVVSLHNELGKMNEADKETAEKRLLHEKITALTTFANKQWVETTQKLETVSSEKIAADYNTAIKRKEKETGEAVAPEIATLAAQTVTMDKFVAQPFNAPPPLIYEMPPASLSYKPLEATDFNFARSYINLTQTKTPEMLSIELITELTNIYNKLFKNGPAAAQYTPEQLVKISLNKLLQDYHAEFYGPRKEQTLTLMNRLVNSIALYGMQPSADININIEKLRQATYDVYTDHMKEYQKEPAYVSTIANNMSHFQAIGVLPDSVSINSEEIVGLSEEDVWQDLFKYAKAQIRSYSWSLMKSTDRDKALAKFTDDVDSIHYSKDATPEKIKKLLAAVNKISLIATSVDLAVDKQKTRFSLFSHRNVTGSRFQEMLNNIRDKASAYTKITPSEQQEDTDIVYVKSLLQQLLEQSRLVKIRNHPVVNQMRSDKGLAAAMKQMVLKGNGVAKQEAILLISRHLHAYAKQFAQQKSIFQDPSLKAYIKFMKDTMVKIDKYQKNNYPTDAGLLRDKIQKAIERLLVRDVVASKKVDMKKFAETIPGRSEDVKLAQGVLFEMERKLIDHYPQAKTVELVKNGTSYSNHKLIAKFKVTLKDRTEFDVPMEVNSLTKENGRTDFAFVQLPQLPDAPTTPVPTRKKSF